MGTLCTNVKLNEIDELLIKPDYIFKQFKSSFEDKFIKERVLYILSSIKLNDYIQIIFSLHSQAGDSLSNSILNKETIPSVFKNKILKNPLFSSSSPLSDKEINQFDLFIYKLFEYLGKNYKSYMKLERSMKVESNLIPKLSLLPLGFLYSSSENKVKISIIFNIFSSSTGKISVSNDFSLFVYFLITTPSNILILIINDIYIEDQSLKRAFSEEEFYGLYRIFEVKDSILLSKNWMKSVFSSKKELDEIEFERVIVDNELYWVFSPEGVRLKFEEMNKEMKES